MSLSGNLEDVSVADVLQFVHLGQSTGTLTLTQAEGRAEITFHRGRIINAWSNDSKKLGELLVSRGIIEQRDLERALWIQERGWPRKSLGQVLTTTNMTSLELIHKAVTRQIEQTIFRVMMWNDGEFEFTRDQLKPIDELGMYPGDVLASIRLNTEQLLLKGAQLWDEGGEVLGRSEEASVKSQREPARLSTQAFTLADVAQFREAVLDPPEPEEKPAPPSGQVALAAQGRQDVRPRLQIVSPDLAFIKRLKVTMPGYNGHLGHVELRDAGSSLPGEPAPIVVVDLRADDLDLRTVATIRRVRPRATIVAMVDDITLTTPSYAAGAAAAVPDVPEAVASCLETLVRDRGFGDFRNEVERAAKAGFNKLRRIVADLRSGVLSATMALNLMHILSEVVERAILFLARPEALAVLGAFGFSTDQKPLAKVCSGVRLPVGTSGALMEVLGSGSPRTVNFGQVGFAPELAARIGEPAFDQGLVMPVMGTEQVIAVIYADNGAAGRPIEEVEMLELAAVQVGIAFENELLRRQLSRQQDEDSTDGVD